MHYLQVAVTTARKDAEFVCDFLSGEGALSVTVESANDQELFDEANPGDPAWEIQRLTALFDPDYSSNWLQSKISKLPVIDAPRISQLEHRDWERTWLDQFEPIQVSDKLWVCPSWLEPPDQDGVNLIIDPGLAFGTGTHATTFQILEYLSGCALKGKTVIDYGCGSGILGIAALALGAHQVVGVDIDPKAVQTAVQNALVNGVEERFEAVSTNQFDLRYAFFQAEVVIANILAGTLLSLKDRLVQLVSANGVLVLSGILEKQVQQVVDCYGDVFEFDQIQQQEWVVLIGIRKKI
ncbi:MAG: 50S ribosomal protein L11 methyltransferase [bacterium]